MLAVRSLHPSCSARADNRILDDEPYCITVADELWLAEWIPFLFAGRDNVSLFGLRFRGASRRQFFLELGYAVWLTHLTLRAAGDITDEESVVMQQVLENYIVT